MNTRQETSKLQELRSKTDRQLIQLLSSRLESGLRDAHLAAEAQDHWSGIECFVSGEKVYQEVSALLPWVREAPFQERRRLEMKLDQLRETLQDSSAHAGQRVQTACS